MRGYQCAGIARNKDIFQTRLFVPRSFVFLAGRKDFLKQLFARTNPSLNYSP
jgi:hypothetical protein